MKTGPTEQVASAGQSPPTIHDVARQAAVSIATVSRVIHSPESVRRETRDRVRATMAALDYPRQNSARRAATSKTGSIGVMLLMSPGITHGDAIFLEILRGIEAAVDADGFTVTVSVCSTDTDQTKEIPRILGTDRIDGLAVTGGPLPAHQLQTIRAAGLPLVVLSADAGAGVWAVTQDHRRGTEQAMRHLFDVGRRRIVHIGGPTASAIPAMKRDGVRLAHERSDIELDPRLYDSGSERHSRERGWRSIERMIEAGIQFDAVFADDDLMALGALNALSAHGRRVPDDVSVVGYGGLVEARCARPALTTVDVDFHQQGWLAGVILTRALKDRSPAMGGQILLETQFTVRESSIAPTEAGEKPLTSLPTL